MRTVSILVAAAGLAVSGTAAAQSFSGAEQIATGDLPGAEREIAQERRLFPNDPDLLINLATVYARTSRTAEARVLYRTVLARPDEDLSLADGTSASAHRIADAGLHRLDAQAIAVR